jgi:hypothetical protein
MSNSFEFGELFGVEAPSFESQFPETTTTNEDIEDRKPSKKIKSRIVMKFHYGEPHALEVRKPAGNNDLYIYVKKKNNVAITKKEVALLRHSGIEFKDIEVLNFSLGKNLVKLIELDPKNANAMVDDLMDWMEINDTAHSEDRGFYLEIIKTYVKTYPSDFEYEPPNGFEQFYELFVLCIELGVIDISNTAGFLQNEVFLALSKSIRDLKLGDERWNPKIGFEEKGAKYDPLLVNSENIKKGISATLDEFLQKEKPVVETDKLTTTDTYAFIIEDKLLESLNGVLYEIKKFIVDALEGLTDLLDRELKMYNALIVGLINGFIELLASIVDAIGLLVGIFNYETQNQLAGAISKFIREFNWATAIVFIKKELKELFAFLFAEDGYEAAYEYGLFIPKIFEIVLDLIGLGKGVLKVGAKLIDITKQLPEMAKLANKALDDFILLLKIPSISKKLREDLVEKGINVSVKLSPVISAAAGFGKVFDGKLIRVDYKGTELKVSKKEAEIKMYMQKLDNDATFYAQEVKRARNKFRNKSETFQKIDKTHKEGRKKFKTANGTLNIDKLRRAWLGNLLINKTEIDNKTLQELSKLRVSSLFNKNFAKGKMIIEYKGEKFEFPYREHAGKGSKKGSEGLAEGRVSTDGEFIDPEYDIPRRNDAEQKIIELMKEDIARLSEQLGIPYDELKVNVKIESTYTPCNICQRDLYLFQEQFKANIEIARPFYVDEHGLKNVVYDHKTFLKL